MKKNCKQFFEQIKFRDFIRSHSEFAKEYELLKQELYKMYADDRKKYTESK
ncbi:GrpB family protein [Clostridium tunisiense]|uniref:GrpB family protein n=1 Tax=Clostridium tunisiense TaxID=219748 RepID=UPI00030D6D65|nr:GrpB family protein [Clostridium tunisiense]